MGAEQPLFGFLSACAVDCGQICLWSGCCYWCSLPLGTVPLCVALRPVASKTVSVKTGGCFKINSIVL